MRAEGFGVTSTEAKDVGIYGVMEAESAEREKEEVMDRIWAMSIFKFCLEKKQKQKNPRARDRGAGWRSIKCGGELNCYLGPFQLQQFNIL